MKILITGGLGVVGSRLAIQAYENGHDIEVWDNGTHYRHVFNKDQIKQAQGGAHPNFPLNKAFSPNNIMTNLVDGAQSVRGFDLIVHAAASTGIPYSAEEPVLDWMDNVTTTLHLVEALRQAGKNAPPTVVLSSVKPYSIQSLPVDENAVLRADEPYAASKAAQSLLCQAYARSYDLPILVFRCSNLYGPAAPHGPRHGWLTWFCIQEALGWPLEIQGSGSQARDMLHTEDVYDAVFRALHHLGDKRGYGGIYNLGGGPGNCVGVLEVMHLLAAHSGNPREPIRAPGRALDDALFLTDTKKFHQATGWKPKVPVLEGIKRTYQWACRHRDSLRGVYAEFEPKETL